MSYQATDWAKKQKTGSPARKVLLLALATYADPHGRCWPSQETLSATTEQSVDTVQRQIRKLEADGHIKIIKRRRKGGQWPRCEYQLSMYGSPPAGPQNAAWPKSSINRPASGEQTSAHSMRLGRAASSSSTEPQALRLENSSNNQCEDPAPSTATSIAPRHEASKRTRVQIQQIQQLVVRKLGKGDAEKGWLIFGELPVHVRVELENMEAKAFSSEG